MDDPSLRPAVGPLTARHDLMLLVRRSPYRTDSGRLAGAAGTTVVAPKGDVRGLDCRFPEIAEAGYLVGYPLEPAH
jgi:hypothetical protein